jgi:signal transduction histidine kinase
MHDVKKNDETFALFFSFHWQWIFLFVILFIFSGFAVWSVLSMTQRAEESFRLEALTNCKVLEVAFADTISQHLDIERIQNRIEDLIEKDSHIVRLSFITLAPDNTYRHVASSLKSRIGKLAHEEDLEAIASGEVIILEEDYKDVGALDITYPVHGPSGNILGLIGYTVSRGESSKEPVILVAAALMVILSLSFYFVFLLRRSFMEIRGHKETALILRDSDRMKSHFISTAAHELRTPLSSISGYVELLLHPEIIGGIDTDTQREFLEEISAKTEALCTLVDDLLDVSRIESGCPIPLERQPCDVGGIIQKEVHHFRIHTPKHSFELSLSENQGSEIWVDQNKIVQVLENLISNAVKFSSSECVIHITGAGTESGYRMVVADEGIGMTPEQVEQVFDKFYRVDYTDTAIGGLGLGMNIVQQIINAHGGNIRVTSELGRGTVVTVDLPSGEPGSPGP